MRALMWLALAIIAGACASGGDDAAATTSATGGSAGAPDVGGNGGDAVEVMASACAAGELALGLDGQGALICDSPIGELGLLLRDNCELAFGARDNCNQCADPPLKWGRASSSACDDGGGTNNTCIETALAGTDVQLLGVNMDGNVNDDDKLYLGWHCAALLPVEPVAGPCAPGQWLVGIDANGKLSCNTIAPTALDFARQGCRLYFGWTDVCNGGCTDTPTKWGSVSSVDCSNGAGQNNTCSADVMLGPTSFQLYGLNTDGDVDNNDQFFLGASCAPIQTEGSLVEGSCPTGTFVRSVNAQGLLECVTPDALMSDAFAQACTFYFGWRDGCNGCTTGPSKWGHLKVDQCINDAGVDNTCSTHMLGPNTVEQFGLNTDGDVDDNDTFFIGMACQPPR